MAWYDFIGDAWDWFSDSDTAQDIFGAIAQQALWDSPEFDYEKAMEMAIKQAMIDSPDQFTPTMISDWTVDPETGERTQNLSYRPEFQGLLDMLVQRAGSPKDTYRAPEAMTGDLLGARMNTLLGQSGLPSVNHQRATFPTYPGTSYDSFGGNEGEDPEMSSPDAGTGQGGSRIPGTETGHESPAVGGGYRGMGDTGYDPADPSMDQQALIRDLIDTGAMMPGQELTDVDWGAVFSDDNLAFVEKWGDNRLVRSILGKLVPLGGVGAKIASWFAGRELDDRFSGNLSDFDNRDWGSFDLWSEPTDGYWQQLLGNAPGVNPDTGARLGEAGGMPGAQHNQGDINDMYGPRRPMGDGWDAANRNQTFGSRADGAGSWGGPGELAMDPRRYRRFWGGPERQKVG